MILMGFNKMLYDFIGDFIGDFTGISWDSNVIENGIS